MITYLVLILVNIFLSQIIVGSSIQCGSEEHVERRRLCGKCMKPIKDENECFEIGKNIGILTNNIKYENKNYWGEGDWPFLPGGCLYINGIITFNTNNTNVECGDKNNAMCLCTPTCYKARPFNIERAKKEQRITKCLNKIAESKNIEKIRILFLGVSTLGHIWNELSSITHEKARKCQNGIPQENEEFLPHSIDFHRWNFISPAISERGHGKAREDIRNRPFCNLPGAPRRLLNNKVEYMRKESNYNSMVVRKAGYNKIVIQVGAWDATWGNSISKFHLSLENVVKYLLEERDPWDIVLVTQTPEGHYLVGDATKVYGHNWESIQHMTLELNKQVLKIATKFNTEFVDAYSLIMAHPQKNKRWFWENGAGWHLSVQSRMSKRLVEEILGKICYPASKIKEQFLQEIEIL